MTILGLPGVLFAKMSRHIQNGLSFVPNKMLSWVPRKARGVLKVTTNKTVTALSLYHTVFCYFLFLSARVLFSMAGYARNDFNTF